MCFIVFGDFNGKINLRMPPDTTKALIYQPCVPTIDFHGATQQASVWVARKIICDGGT